MGVPKHNFGFEYGPVLIPDPGDGEDIVLGDAMLAHVLLNSAGTETRTLLSPATVGQVVTLNCDTDGGQITVTVDDGLQLTELLLGAAGQAVVLEAVRVSGSLKWKRISGVGDLVVTHTMLLNADCIDQQFFRADRVYDVIAIYEIHAVAGNDASAVNMQVTKDSGTNAPGAGTNLLTNNTNAGFDMKGTAQTEQTGTLSATASDLRLAEGDRLSVDFAGTVTTLSGVMVTVVLRPLN